MYRFGEPLKKLKGMQVEYGCPITMSRIVFKLGLLNTFTFLGLSLSDDNNICVELFETQLTCVLYLIYNYNEKYKLF